MSSISTKAVQRTPEPLFEQALAVEPASAPALSGIAAPRLARGQTARAIEHLERALAVGPPAWDIHYNLATAYRDAGNPERAEEHLSQRGGDPPEPPDPLMRAYESLLRSPRAYETRGVAAMQDGRTAEAVEIFREGLAQTPDDASLHQQLGSALFANGDANGAAEELEAALRLDPTQARAHAGLGTLASMGGRQAEAIERFAAAVENDPDYLEARLGLVDAYRAAGERRKHWPSWTGQSRSLRLRRRLAGARADAGATRPLPEARDRLDEARAVHPRHAGLTDLLVRVLAASPDPRARDGRRALALAEPLLGAAPNPTLDATVAMALAAVGRYGEAADGSAARSPRRNRPDSHSWPVPSQSRSPCTSRGVQPVRHSADRSPALGARGGRICLGCGAYGSRFMDRNPSNRTRAGSRKRAFTYGGLRAVAANTGWARLTATA